MPNLLTHVLHHPHLHPHLDIHLQNLPHDPKNLHGQTHPLYHIKFLSSLVLHVCENCGISLMRTRSQKKTMKVDYVLNLSVSIPSLHGLNAQGDGIARNGKLKGL
jgi:hypothetical protein